MLNGDRIVLMTKLASYEKKEGKRCMAIGRYFRGDYVTLNILKAVISATIAFFIGLALYILYDIESLMENLYSMDLLLLAKNIDGIYSADPKVDASAVKFDEISYMDVIQKGLKAMDTTAISMCMENNIPILAFGVNEQDSIIKAVKGDKIGTIIK